MICIENNSFDPYFNHGLEEYLLNEYEEDIFILWINKPSVLLGRNQNAYEEIDYNFIKKNNIEVVRRLSGGGAIYNDYNIIQFTFITSKNSPLFKSKNKENAFQIFAEPVIKALHSLGVEAEFSGRNDILVEGKKISGNAQYSIKNRTLHHGTLLFDGEISILSQALQPRKIKFANKSVKSVKSRVGKIREYLKEDMDTLSFKKYLENFILEYYKIDDFHLLTKKEYEKIEEITNTRFRKNSWNYGKSLEYKYGMVKRYNNCGIVEYYMDIEEDRIKDISILGDYFGKEDRKQLEDRLRGEKLDKSSLHKKIAHYKIDDYIKNLDNETFINGLLEAGGSHYEKARMD